VFNEEAIRENYVLIYELFDEVMDNGYPQSTGDELFRLYITQKGKFNSKKAIEAESGKTTALVTGAIPWRSPDIRHKKNEIFIDVIESVNVLVSNKQGTLLHADVAGEIKMKCILSGMPECRFGLNDKLLLDREAKVGAPRSRTGGIEIDDCSFHPCVRLSKFDSERTISFIPPDGDFQLMKYRTTENISLPFRIIPNIQESATRVEYKVNVKSDFIGKLFGNDIVITIPTPKNTANCKISTASGRAKYEPSHDAIVWRIKKFPGETEYQLSATADLISTNNLDKKAWARPPISMQFSVPMFTSSGLHVRFLKVVEAKLHYQTVKWVRYVTQGGQYQYRI